MDTKLTTSVRLEPDLLELIDLYAGSKQWSRNKAINVLLGQAVSLPPKAVAEGATLAVEGRSDPKPLPPRKRDTCDHVFAKSGRDLRCSKCRKTMQELR